MVAKSYSSVYGETATIHREFDMCSARVEMAAGMGAGQSARTWSSLSGGFMKSRLFLAIFAASAALLVSGTAAQAAAPPSAVKASTATAGAAVPGIAPSDDAGIYLDQQGQVIASMGKAGKSQVSAASTCTPVSGRDNPHYTAPDVSGHGWWGKGNCTGATATVFNCLYEYWTDGTWRQQACSAHEKLKPGTGGSSYRTNARVACDSTGQTISWRNHVDVDVNGQSDTGEQPYNQANVNCVVG